VIVNDNGPEFTSKAVDSWAYNHKVRLDFFGLGNLWRTLSSRVSMAGCETSASMSTGFSVSKMPERKSRRGNSAIMVQGHTALYAI